MSGSCQHGSCKPKRAFVENQHISQHLYCSVCQDIFEDPVRVICGHTFCYMCIEKWAQIRKTCPICKQSIKGRKLQKDLIASQIIDDLIIECTHQGCHWKDKYSCYKKHQRWCEFKPRRNLLVPTNMEQVVECEDESNIQVEVIESSDYIKIDS